MPSSSTTIISKCTICLDQKSRIKLLRLCVQTSPCSLASTFKRASSSQPLHFQSPISFRCQGNHFRSLFPTSSPSPAASSPTLMATSASFATTRASTSFTQRPLSFPSTASSHPSTSPILSRSSSLFWLPSEVSSQPSTSSPPHLHGRLEPTPKCKPKIFSNLDFFTAFTK
ncbi:hypothetical protein WN944_005470 [Citrus x changshan-huyou]|uniref:Uncharacterized protein n=1 Tax=Citrus x changshan-huyou TaxID=2935761 RepID=A0AAP0M2H2_9ROSI